MKQHYWFKANKTGYGWHPHTWQGWLVFFTYIGLLIHSYFQVNSIIEFITRFILFTAILTIITYLKGESITWGAKGKDQHEIP
jgi:hypothetical protein